RRIVVACPRPSAEILAASARLRVGALARVGGAQSIAALAYGTASVEPVDKIVGPGNRYVTAAKRLVSADREIDFPAGPTEVLVLAVSGDPRFIAADLLAQAEHDADAIALLVTTSSRLAREVSAEVELQLAALPKTNPARRAIARNGAALVARSLDSAIAFTNRLAPEHLALPGAERAILRRIDAAGSVFLGPLTAQSLGDFATGSNHTLPTSGIARSRGGLSVSDFVRLVSVQEVTRDGLRRLRPVVKAFAEAEGLVAHGRAVDVRGDR
ncbi:MAG: histidinol dehydrogenase, partial [Chloroflexota bacterium]